MKMNRVKWIAAALALTLVAAVAVCETVQAGHFHRRAGFDSPMVRMFARQLNLTDAQRTQMHQILAKEKPTMQPLMQQMAQSRLQIAQLELNGAFDESQVRPLASQQAQAMQDFIVQRARVESELIQVLTPDQKTKLGQLLTQHQERLTHHTQQPTNQ
jgi:periplasmic protein CpxP/Spy